MKVLITGFDPFGSDTINPSYEAVKRLDDEIQGAQIIKKQIPTVFGKAITKLEEYIQEYEPDFVICVGQAGGRFDLTIERVAINMDDARIMDNEGNQPIDEVVMEDGKNAYFSNLPIKAMVAKLKENNIPSNVSNSAGTFVCNHIMYGLLYMIDKSYNHIKGGFIHVPFIPEQVIGKKNSPYMTLNELTKGLSIAIETAVTCKEDIKMTGGAIC